MQLLFVMKSRKNIEHISRVAYILCKTDNDEMLKNTIIKKIHKSNKLMLESVIFYNQQLSISII